MYSNSLTIEQYEENIEFLEFLLKDLKARKMDPMDINFIENEIYKAKLEAYNLKTYGRISLSNSGTNMGHITIQEQEELLLEFERMLGSNDLPPPIPMFCSCGAKHTSNPKYHLQYCDLHK